MALGFAYILMHSVPNYGTFEDKQITFRFDSTKLILEEHSTHNKM